MFKLLRFYAAASFVAVLATAALLTWFYRQLAVQGIFQLAERSNMNLAQLAMNPIKPALLAFLDAAGDLHPGSTSSPVPRELARSITSVMHDDHSIVRIKIYNRRGVVVFATTPADVGDDQSRNEGFIAAMRGGVGSKLVYRDTFNSFDRVTEEDNLMQTYLPVRAGPAEPVLGVFEVYSDVDSLVRQTERTGFMILTGALLIMSALYVVLILVVRHANKTIELQQRTISERNETLALLADHMLKAEESHKQRVAVELHEGVAQTLAAIKLKVESGQRDHKGDAAAPGPVGSMIPLLQKAIQQVRAIATDLRPASLDDFGLLPTVQWFCRELEQRHPGIRIERRMSLDERDIPVPLKGILYGVIVSALGEISQKRDIAAVRLALSLDENELVLFIDEAAAEEFRKLDVLPTQVGSHLDARFTRMEELTTLSGGAFTATHRIDGGTTLRATWNRWASKAEEPAPMRRANSA